LLQQHDAAGANSCSGSSNLNAVVGVCSNNIILQEQTPAAANSKYFSFGFQI